MLDFAMAFATQTGIPSHASCGTASLTVSFLRPAEVGRYRAEGQIERRGKSMAFAKATLAAQGSNALVATATSVLVVREG
jgi:acyl-coenzyme A thioesterase PaaI-like protein